MAELPPLADDAEELPPIVRAARTDLQRNAARNLADLQAQGAAAGYDQDIANAQAKFAGDMAGAIPVAATLATGGLAAPVAVGIMGLAGVAKGTYGEAAKLALGADDTSGYSGILGTGEKNAPSGGAVDSPEQLARRLGVEFAIGTTTQMAANVGGELLALGKDKVLMPLVSRAAANVDAGKSILGRYGVNLMNKIRNLEAASASKLAPPPGAIVQSGTIPPPAPTTIQVNINPELDTLTARLAARGTGQSAAFKQAAPGLSEKLTAWDGSLSQLVEIKGAVSQLANKRAGMNFEEVAALKEFAGAVDRKLKQKFYEIGGSALYKGFNEVQNQLHKFEVGVQVAEKAAGHLASRAAWGASGAVAGGVGGWEQGHSAGAVIKGALAGAAVGTTIDFASKKLAPLLLEKLLGDKLTAPLARQAIVGMERGDAAGAMKIMARAATLIGADRWVKAAAKDMLDNPNWKALDQQPLTPTGP